MKKFVVCFEDATTGAKSEIDIITATDDYTPEKYIEDCNQNGVDWGKGDITFSEVED